MREKGQMKGRKDEFWEEGSQKHVHPNLHIDKTLQKYFKILFTEREVRSGLTLCGDIR